MHEIPEWMPRVMEEIEEILMLKTQSYLEVDSILSLIVFSTTTKLLSVPLGPQVRAGFVRFLPACCFPIVLVLVVISGQRQFLSRARKGY
jgi:formate/nitrite transporter FocA (FNT family)